MSNYSKTTDFAAKDSLPSGDSGKIIRGSEFETEFDNISTAIATKADAARPTFTGTVTIDGLTVNGNTTLGNAATDTVTVTADIASNLIPSADDTYNLGASGAEWNDLYVDGVAYIDTINGFTTTGNVTFGDNVKLQLGDKPDLLIYHDGSESIIRDAGAGNLNLRGNSVSIANSDASTSFIEMNNGSGAVSLYHANAEKFQTTSTGIDVTGVITTDGMTTSADINFGDNDKAVFGAGNDLQIYHDGSNSYVQDTGAGNLVLRGGNFVVDASTAGNNRLITANATSKEVKLYHEDNQKLVTTSTGIDVTGTVTADGLTVDGTSDFNNNNINHTGTSPKYNFFESDKTDLNSQLLSSGGKFFIRTLSDDAGTVTKRFEIDHATGDISFYEDTGSTAKLFWDASAESLGIGTSSPSERLHVQGTGSTARALIESTNTADGQIEFQNNTTTNGLFVGLSGSTSGDASIYHGDAKNIVFSTSATEAMRIDSSGNVLVGTTSTNPVSGNVAGTSITDNGTLLMTRDAGTVAFLNRKTSDGTVAEFRKNNTAFGEIGVFSGDMIIGLGDHKLRFFDGSNAISPCESDGTVNDGTIDLGVSNSRFKDLYLSGGLYVGGTAAANKLDDYEEGTWTPTAQNYEGTLTVNAATYTKIGNVVTLRCDLSFDSTSDGSGVNIVGLPFNHTGANKGNGGFCTKDTSGTTEYITGEGSASILLYNDSYGSVTYTNVASGSVAFVYIYETTS